MKTLTVVVFCLCASVALAQLFPPPPLDDECNSHDPDSFDQVIQEWLGILPTVRIMALILQGLSEDAEVQNAFSYLQSEDFEHIVTTVQAMPEFLAVMDYWCTELKFNIYHYLNIVGNILDLPQITRPPFPWNQRNTGGLRQLFEDISAIIPTEELEEFWADKRANDPVTQHAVESLSSADFIGLVSNMQALPEWQALLQGLRDHGFDGVDCLIYNIGSSLGWPTGHLNCVQ